MSPRQAGCLNLATCLLTALFQSQFSLVIERELPQIQGAFKKFPNYSPKLSVVVCGKRHHARFFGTSPDQVMDNGNTPPGTVIDKGVTDVYNYDFYLQASFLCIFVFRVADCIPYRRIMVSRAPSVQLTTPSFTTRTISTQTRSKARSTMRRTCTHAQPKR